MKILKDYGFNIPKGKTQKSKRHGGYGGKCPRPCQGCVAINSCGGCDGLCPDRECLGTECARCACRCSRGGQYLHEAIAFVGGLDINMSEQHDTPFNFDTQSVRYIPAITKPLRIQTTYPVVSIPFYALWDFRQNCSIVEDIRKTFNLSASTQIIVNFYFKDDKIAYLFDKIVSGEFFPMLEKFPDVDYWHTPCFSVFTMSSGMDALLNFKRQFWIGDRMRESGLNVIQEVLYSLKPRIRARISDALTVIKSKRILKVSQNCQLIYDFTQSLIDEREFTKELPRHISWLQTGLSSSQYEAYRRLRWQNTFFCNYSGEFRHKKEWECYVNGVNSQFLS